MMIHYFNAPARAVANAIITKKLFMEQMKLTATEKKLIKNDLSSLQMKLVLRPETIGLKSFESEEYDIKQLVVAELLLNRKEACGAMGKLVQQAFPYPLIVLFRYQNEYCINWADKRINQSDRSKRVTEDMKFSRWFDPDANEELISNFCRSLDVTKPLCYDLKELFEELKKQFQMLQVADEIGIFVQATSTVAEPCFVYLKELRSNRENQRELKALLKAETQFNARLKLNTALAELRNRETELKLLMKSSVSSAD